MIANLTRELAKRMEYLCEDIVTAWRESIHTRCSRSLPFRSAKPAPPRHSRQHRIQSAGAHSIPAALQFIEHPLTIHAVFGRVAEDLDLPEGKKKLAYDRIAHDWVTVSSLLGAA